jgi:hypothetical protein
LSRPSRYQRQDGDGDRHAGHAVSGLLTEQTKTAPVA